MRQDPNLVAFLFSVQDQLDTLIPRNPLILYLRKPACSLYQPIDYVTVPSKKPLTTGIQKSKYPK
jgi:hypothetical protein